MSDAPLLEAREARRWLGRTLAVLLAVVFLLGVLHWLFAGLREGGVYWFNLDKERNLPTWFSGIIFSLWGCAALAAFYWESERNRQGLHFLFPSLWLGVAGTAFLMSLDEVTVLHENLFWREVRNVSAGWGAAWQYVTQWQIVFAPALVLAFAYLAVFLSQRLRISGRALLAAWGGLGCWMVALGLEASRELLRQAGPGWYDLEVLAEELLEMLGGLLMLASIAHYTIDIALDFTPERISRLARFRFLDRRTARSLILVLLGLSLAALAAYLAAEQLSSRSAPVPRLVRRALEDRPHRSLSPSLFQRPAAESRQFSVWFPQVVASRALPSAEALRLARWMRGALLEKEDPSSLSPFLRQDRLPRVVLLSLGDGTTPAWKVIGTARGILAAARDALAGARRLTSAGLQARWLRLDIVTGTRTRQRMQGVAFPSFHRSLEGLAFAPGSSLALLPAEVMAHALVSSKGDLVVGRLERYLQSRSLYHSPLLGSGKWSNLPFNRFTTRSYFLDKNGPVPLYRGHRFFRHLTRRQLREAALQAGEYLMRNLDERGRFVYLYHPKTDKVPEAYNMVRHAGTLYAMLELYAVSGKERLLEASRRALAYLLASTRAAVGPTAPALALVERGYVKLGGNALAAVALAEYIRVTGDRRYLEELRGLVHWIVKAQDASGRFAIQKQSYPEGRVIPLNSIYFPGEALLALVRVFAVDPDPKWLDAAERGARYLIEVRDGALPDSKLVHDHWLLYALGELYRLRRLPLYREHVSRLARVIVRAQNREPRYPDWLGSYYRPPRSTPTATRTEGLCAAYRLLGDFGRPGEAPEVLEAIQAGIRFELQTQFRPESALYLKDPARCLGAFHRSLTNYEIRIDYVQHNISALLGLYQILGQKE